MPNNSRVEDLFYMASALQQALTQGIDFWAEDTGERSAWLCNDPLARHIFAGTMLVGLFAYTEGKLGKRWWRKLRSNAARQVVPILWRARNAFVHGDSRLEVNSFNSQSDVDEFLEYCRALERGEIKDDKGNRFPEYMSIIGSEIRFNDSSFHIFRSTFVATFNAERLGRLP